MKSASSDNVQKAFKPYIIAHAQGITNNSNNTGTNNSDTDR